MSNRNKGFTYEQVEIIHEVADNMPLGKVDEWDIFSAMVQGHIQNYVIPQYGDNPDRMVEDFNLRDIKKQLDRYVKRIGAGARGLEEEKRDALKIAHYAFFLHKKLETD